VRQRCGDGVLALGRVENLPEIFDRVRLTVAPLRFGAGIKGKVIDSLAAGVPCVMTPIGAEGLDLPAALERCIATTAEATAAAIGHLHNDRKANAACRAAGLDYIEEVFSEAQLDALMRQALGPAIRALAKNETVVAK
jgi:glycosyltransferase involved in cell wall biosynthesis